MTESCFPELFTRASLSLALRVCVCARTRRGDTSPGLTFRPTCLWDRAEDAEYRSRNTEKCILRGLASGGINPLEHKFVLLFGSGPGCCGAGGSCTVFKW